MPDLTFGEIGKCFTKNGSGFYPPIVVRQAQAEVTEGKAKNPFFWPLFPTLLPPGIFSDSSFFSR